MNALNELVSGFCQPDEPEYVIVVRFVAPSGEIVRARRYNLSARPSTWEDLPERIGVRMDLGRDRAAEVV